MSYYITHKKYLSTYKVLAVFLFFVLCFMIATTNAIDEDSASVILNDFKLPEYNKNTKQLEFIVYGEKAETIGIQINLTDVKVEWVDNDINKVKATITAPEAVYDKVTKMIKGDKEVHFRSPEMDADGIGFDADYEKQTIHIRSNVRVFLKQDLQETEKNKQRKVEQ